MTPAGKVTAFLAVLAATPALAHSPTEGIGSFYAGLLHPLVVPSHAMALTSLALMLGQNGFRAARAGLTAALVALCLGLAAGQQLPETLPFGNVLLAATLVLGARVALALPLPGAAATFGAGLVALGVGLDSAPAPAPAGDTAAALAGTAAGAALLLVILTGLIIGRDADWQRIGIRIAGSWVAAIALLVLALAVAPAERQLSQTSNAFTGPAPC